VEKQVASPEKEAMWQVAPWPLETLFTTHNAADARLALR
jgi:hypothetical protein